MKLSQNFTLGELTKTDTGFPNEPDEKAKGFLLLLVIFILQPTRDRLGGLKVSSGFRSLRVNKEVGGSPTSQHPEGQAADIVPLEINLVSAFKWIVDCCVVDFGQCIIYPDRGFIHVSLPRLHKPNRQALICYKGEYLPYSEAKLNEIVKENLP